MFFTNCVRASSKQNTKQFNLALFFRPTKLRPPTIEMLCDICTLIDFEEIYASLENTPPDKYGIIVAPLRDGLGRDVNSDCTLCRLFYALPFPVNGSTEYHLRAMSAFRSHIDFEFSRIPASIKSHDNIFLSVLPGGVQSKLKLDHWDWDAFRSHSRDKGFICRIRPVDQPERIWARAISLAQARTEAQWVIRL
jgi:hypothetical protein